MIIKLPFHFTYARHKEEKIAKPLTLKDKIQADRIVMTILFALVIGLAIIFA